MEILKVILLAVGLVAIAMVGLGIRMLLVKGGKFPNTHVGGNKHLQKEGVPCATTQDKMAQAAARKENKFKNISMAGKPAEEK